MIKPYIEQLHLRGGKVVPEELSPINEIKAVSVTLACSERLYFPTYISATADAIRICGVCFAES